MRDFLKNADRTMLALLEFGDRVVVGVSGGADSVALLSVLHELASDYELALTVAHLNHCIRGRDADLDEEFVRNLAAELGLECIAERVDVPAIRARDGGSLEEAGRRERYAFYERAATAAGASKIAVGHNKNDNAETVLQRILRGTGLRGLQGIPPHRPLHRGSDLQVIRPLIDVTRQEILEYLAIIGRDYRTDASNNDTTYLRNRLRHVILPMLEAEFGPGVTDSLNRLAENARYQYNLIEPEVEELLRRARLDEPGALLALDRKKILMAGEVGIEALRLALQDEGTGQLTSGHCEGLFDMMTTTCNGRQMSLPGGLTLRVEGDKLLLVDPAREPEEAYDEIELPIPGAAEFAGFRLSVPVIDDPPNIEAVLKTWDRCEEMVDTDQLELPLSIRARRPGDRFRPLGAPGSRKLHDFFIDEKVPAHRRDSVPLVCDRAGIVWVAGYRIAHRVRITAGTRRATVIAMRACAARDG